MSIVEAIVGACPRHGRRWRGLGWALVFGVVGWAGSGAWAQGTSGPLWATSVPQIPNPPGGWDFEEQAEGNPGCGDPCTDCNDGNETYAVNAYPQSPSSREVEPLVATNFQGFTLPAGNRISRVRVDVLGRYNSGDTGEVRVEVVIPGVGTLTRNSGPFTNTTSCRYILDRAGLDDITSAVGCGWTQAMVNGMTVRVARIRDGSNTNLRIKAFRLIVDFVPVAQPPSSVSATPNPVCPGGTVTLTANGGSGTRVEWFVGACGGTPFATGNPIQVNVNEATNFLARWVDDCTASACTPVGVGVVAPPVPVSSITAVPAEPCVGEVVVLTANGGSGTTLRWFSGTCGGTVLGTGNPLQVTVSAPTTYLARWENSCSATPCASITLTPRVYPVAPVRVDVSPPDPCVGSPVTLTAVGGSGTTIEWFQGGCGGPVIGSVNPLQIAAPAAATTYYARWRTPCGASGCASATVTPAPAPMAPTSIGVVPQTPCAGAPMSLFVNGGSGGTVEWFIGTCAGAPVATGNPWNTTAPSVPTTYLARWVGACGTSDCSPPRMITPALPPVAPTEVRIAPSTSCPGETLTLSVEGGSGDTVEWFTGSCAGVPFASGNPITVAAPSVATVYLARWTTLCAGSACADEPFQPRLAPVVTPGPAQAGQAGGSATLCVTAEGSGPLTYVWRRGATVITNGGRYSGAETACLRISELVAGDAGTYCVEVSGACPPSGSGCVDLTVRVCELEFLEQPPDAASEHSPYPVTIRAIATGEGALSYEWRRDGVALPDGGRFGGARTATLTINNSVRSDTGRYTCVVTDSCGSDESEPCEVTIWCPADFNEDGVANSQDFFDFLDCFFRGCLRADFNRDGFINTQDFFDFLTAFFRPCV